jgi:hypothetical protein
MKKPVKFGLSLTFALILAVTQVHIPSSSALASPNVYFPIGNGNWIISPTSLNANNIIYTVGTTFSATWNIAGNNLAGCSQTTEEDFSVQDNIYQSGSSFPWNQLVVAVNDVGGNSCFSVWNFATATSTPGTNAFMIGYSSEFYTASSSNYVTLSIDASSGSITSLDVTVQSPTYDSWQILPGAGTLPNSMSYATSSDQNFIFVAPGSTSTTWGTSYFFD